MSKLENFTSGIPVTGGFTPKGDGTFPLIEAHDVVVDENDTRLDEKLENIGGTVYSLQPIPTTGNNTYFQVSVPGIEELVTGLNLIIIPHITSNSQSPYLMVNDLGNYPLCRRGGVTTGVNSTGYSANWLTKGIPISVMFSGSYWIVDDMKKHAAADLYGTLPIAKGGTGATDAATALTNLGAAAADHTHTLSDLDGYNNVATMDELHAVYDLAQTNEYNIKEHETSIGNLEDKVGGLSLAQHKIVLTTQYTVGSVTFYCYCNIFFLSHRLTKYASLEEFAVDANSTISSDSTTPKYAFMCVNGTLSITSGTIITVHNLVKVNTYSAGKIQFVYTDTDGTLVNTSKMDSDDLVSFESCVYELY